MSSTYPTYQSGNGLFSHSRPATVWDIWNIYSKHNEKMCSAALFIKKIQIKTTIRWHYPLTGVAKIKVWPDVEQMALSFIGSGNTN